MEGGEKRELTYCSLSLVLPILALCTGMVTLNDVVTHVNTQLEIPFQIMSFLLLSEVVKLAIVFTLFTSTQDATEASSGWRRVPRSSKLPTYKKDHSGQKTGGLRHKVVKMWKGFWHYFCCCGICYIFCILFGAPLLRDFVLSVEFSVILVSWTFAPLCFSFSPTSVLFEVASISLWDTRLESIWRAKIRFVSCIVGAMAGAALIPLDWDRPWQRWPLPCLITLSITYAIANAVSVLFMFYTHAFKNFRFCSTNETNVRGKVKNF